MAEFGISVVLVVVVVLVHLVRRRRNPDGPASTGLLVIAVLTAALPAAARLLVADKNVIHALSVLPICAYVLYGLYWLIRNRREIAAAWKAETEHDRERGLR